MTWYMIIFSYCHRCPSWVKVVWDTLISQWGNWGLYVRTFLLRRNWWSWMSHESWLRPAQVSLDFITNIHTHVRQYYIHYALTYDVIPVIIYDMVWYLIWYTGCLKKWYSVYFANFSATKYRFFKSFFSPENWDL